MNREVDLVEEELRLKNSSQLMYGNQDHDKVFPFDPRMRFKYLVYHEALGRTEDGQIFPKKTTRRFSFFDPTQWDEKIARQGKKTWFEAQGKTFTILHDPLKQAKLEGVRIKGYHADKTGLSLSEKLARAKNASDIVSQDTPQVVTTFDSGIVYTTATEPAYTDPHEYVDYSKATTFTVDDEVEPKLDRRRKENKNG
jgi:hypothetical protein